VVKRHFAGEVGAVAFTDLVSAEQNLVTLIGNYLPILQAQWQAVVDVSNFLQTEQLYEMVETVEGEAEPAFNLEELLRLPCRHECAPGQLAPSQDGFRMAPVTSSLATAPRIPAAPTAAIPLSDAPPRARFAAPQ
jgi:hypothetical protein